MKQLKQYKKNGYEFEVVERNGNIARAVGRKGSTENHEVFVVQSHDGRTIAGNYCEPAEFPPSNEQWGSKGWTAMDQQSAIDRFKELVDTRTSA